MAARRAAIDARRQQNAAAKTQRNQTNSATLAEYMGNGVRHYTDPATGLIVPEKDDQGRTLYHATPWEDGGTHPQTGEPTLVKRDQFGQRQFRTPPIIASPDLTDTQLYYKFGDNDLRPAGEIAALKAHANPKIATLAKRADAARRSAAWKEALEPMKAAHAGAMEQFNEAQQQELDLQGKIDALTEQAGGIDDATVNATSGGILGFGAKPTPEALAAQGKRDGLSQQIQSLELQKAALHDQVKPGGALHRMQRNAALDLHIFTAKAKHEAYADLAEQRRDILKAQGKPEDSDPVLKSILQAQQAYGGAVQRAAAVSKREMELQAKQQAAQVPAPQPASTSAPFTALAQSAVSGLGGIAKGMQILGSQMPPVDDFGRYFDESQGAEWERMQALPPAEKMKAIQSGEAYQFGSALQQAAKEVYPLTPEEEKSIITKAGSMAGGFLPLVASGPGAPLTIGLQTAGDEMEAIYRDKVAKGASPDAAASPRAVRAGCVVCDDTPPRRLSAGGRW